MGPPLDTISRDNLQQRFATGKNNGPRWQAYTRAPDVHGLGIINHAPKEYRTNRDLAMPKSILRVTRLWYILPALLYSADGSIKKRQKVMLAESGNVVLHLPWLMKYTGQGDTSKQYTIQEASEGAML